MSFNYDIKNDYFLQSRFVGLLQRAVLRHLVRVPDVRLRQRHSYNGVNKDKRFSIAITLAGLGSFSPFFGGMGNPTNQMYR